MSRGIGNRDGSESSKTGLTALSHGLLLIFTVGILGLIKVFSADVFLDQAPFLAYQSYSERLGFLDFMSSPIL